MYICLYTSLHMTNIDIYMFIWIYGYMDIWIYGCMDICNYEKEIYMCIYWFILLYT